MISFKRLFLYLGVSVIALAIASCSPGGILPGMGGGQTSDVANPLVNSRWTLASFGEGDAETPVLSGTEVTLEFDDAGLAAGSGGCNTFSASYHQQDGEIAFGEIVTTERACTTAGVKDQEQHYYQALHSADQYQIDGDRLQIRYDSGVLNFVNQNAAAVATSTYEGNQLEDTHWALVSYGEPGAEKPAVADAVPTLEFNDQGQASGSGGCNSFGASYSVSGDTLSFGQLTSTLMLCAGEDAGEQETEYFNALQNAGRFQLTGDSLTIWYEDGEKVLNFIPAEARLSKTPVETSAELCATPGEVASDDWVLCRSQTFGFEVQYPKASELEDQTVSSARINLPMVPGTNLVEKYLEISAAEAEQPCSSPLIAGSDPESFSPEPIRMNGLEFQIETGGGVATGNIYDWVAYSISQGNTCISLGFVLHYFDPANVLTPPPEFDYPGETSIFEEIVSSFRWLEPAVPTETASLSQPIPAPERIRFESGATSARVSGELQASGSDLYVLYALAGQTMTVDLSFAEGGAILAVWGEDGNVLMSDHAEASQFERVLPTSQDYFVLLKGRLDGGTEYTMTITIPPR